MGECYRAAIRVGQRITVLRHRQQLSVRALAKKARMPHTHLLKIEQGTTNSPIETLARLAQALGVTLYELFREDTPEADTRQVVMVPVERHALLECLWSLVREDLSAAPPPHLRTFPQRTYPPLAPRMPHAVPV